MNELTLFTLTGLQSRNWSRCFPTVDQLPWFIFTAKNRLSTREPEPLTLHLNLGQNQALELTIWPASLGSNGNCRLRYPSPKDDLIVKAVRYHQATVGLSWEPRSLTFQHTFSLHAISCVLQQWGHSIAPSRVRQALDTYAGAVFSIKAPYFDGEKKLTRLTYTRIEARWRITLNELEAAAIHAGDYLALNCGRTMAFKHPLARRIAEIVTIQFRNAAKAHSRSDPAFDITFHQLVGFCGLQTSTPRKLRSHLLDALEFLKEQNFLRSYQLQPTLQSSHGPGRPSPHDIRLKLWLSDRDAEDIIRANIERRSRSGNKVNKHVLQPDFPLTLLDS